MIKVANLLRSYGKITAVNDVSFEIGKGEIVGLLGHNGAGKTTVMKMITGYIEPDAGKVTIKGLDLSQNLLACQELIGYLPENCPSYSELTVAEYLEFAAKLKGISNPESKINSAIQKVKLRERITQKIGTLSKGFQQRVGVAQAILSEPEILVLDEPTNGLDPHQIQDMRKLIKDLSQTSTVVLSTHILQEVEAVCDRVLVMMQGKLVLDQKMSDLQRSEALLLESDHKSLKAVLEKVSGVKSIVQSAINGVERYQIELKQGGSETVSQIASLVQQEKGKIFCLAPKRESLDEIFRKLEAQV